MDRRSLLLAGAGLAATAAGCASLPGMGDEAAARAPRASLRLDPADDREIARRLDRHVPEGDGTRVALLDEVLETGSATRESRRPRLRAGTLVHAGTRYDLSIAVENRRPATVYPILLENLSYDGVQASNKADRVRFEDLPAVDRRVFRENGLADRFRSATDVRDATEARADDAPRDATGERSGTYLVRFEGAVYLTRLHLFEPSDR